MRRINTFFYGFGQGIKNIYRNRMFSMASVATMAACLFLFGVFYIVIVNFRFMVHEAENNVGITVFFDDDADRETIEAIGDKIRARAEVSKLSYTSAEEAWETYKTEKLSPELAESFGDDNPLAHSDSFTVYMNDVAMQEVLVKYIKGLKGVRKVNDTADIAVGLAGFNTMVAVISAVVIGILLLVATFLISITISTGVSVRREEISIMKLIGATNYFIRIPFVVEGALIGLIGAGVPVAVLSAGYSKVTGLIAEEFASVFNMVKFVEEGQVMTTLIPVSLALGIGIGLVGSSLTLKRQLRKIEVGV